MFAAAFSPLRHVAPPAAPPTDRAQTIALHRPDPNPPSPNRKSQTPREYLRQDLAAFKSQHPHADVTAALRRGGHPFVEAEFSFAVQTPRGPQSARVVGLRNLGRAGVGKELWWLASSQGRAQGNRAPAAHVSPAGRSVQGAWTPFTFDPAAAAQPSRAGGGGVLKK